MQGGSLPTYVRSPAAAASPTASMAGLSAVTADAPDCRTPVKPRCQSDKYQRCLIPDPGWLRGLHPRHGFIGLPRGGPELPILSAGDRSERGTAYAALLTSVCAALTSVNKTSNIFFA